MAKRKASESTAERPPRRPITTDPRFSVVHSDPRFARPKKTDTKLVLDSRFKNKLAADKEFKSKRIVDRYGRKVDADEVENELKRYYQLDKTEDDEDDDVEKIDFFPKPGYDPARGEGLESSSDEGEDTEEEVDEDEDVFETTVQEESIPRGDETSTFAVVNMDWDNVRAEDLMVAFSSFAPATGRVLSVTVFPSEFGKERMAREEIEGPPKEVFSLSKSALTDDSHLNDDELLIKEDNGEDVDTSKLRKYQLQRLRYYYAVVRCDSVATARRIYNGCDGTEYESTANFFDLRYVAEDMDFNDKPRDVCTKVPSSYRPNEFVTDALQHSKVRLTWDETPAERLQFARRAFSRREIEEMDFKAYVASSESESDDESGQPWGDRREKLREKYRALLLDSKNDTGFDEKDDVDMEITFTPGLSAEAKDEEKEDEETTIEKYRRKERERKAERMSRYRAAKGESNDTVADTVVRKKKSKTKLTKEEAAEQDRSKAELELLMMDEDAGVADDGEDGNLKHFDMRDIVKAEKRKKNKKIRNKKETAAADVQDDFQIDVTDPRFAALYERHEFAIDPSRPQFKETNAMKKLLEERRKRQRSKGDSME
ncbi:uncharacterized protein V1518DRAFT_412831 [Limtongia smithiae]|uniref:uncharacterized protein n=1 Tax=Limtongia smithiae TaxID=1125753 RepID=UPI0034CEBB43